MELGIYSVPLALLLVAALIVLCLAMYTVMVTIIDEFRCGNPFMGIFATGALVGWLGIAVGFVLFIIDMIT